MAYQLFLVLDRNISYHIILCKKKPWETHTHKNVNINVQCTQFPYFLTWNNPSPVDKLLKPVDQSINLSKNT